MAETTITGLPNATTPLDGTERVPMDQAGATKDATTQDIANLAGAAISSAVASHVAAADPHSQYLTQAEGDGRYRQSATALSDSDIPAGIARDSEVAAAIGAHEAAADPHPGYLTAAEGAAAYVGLSDARLSDAREWTAATIEQAEAEAGTATTRRAFTAQRVRQAIAAWWTGVSTAAGRAMVEALDAAAQRTLLGLGTADSPSFTGLTITGTAPVVIPNIHGSIAGNFYVHVKNTSGGPLEAGTVVYATGSVGDTDRITVAACNPTDPLKMPAIAVLETTLANNGDGDAVVLGELRPFNTNSYQLGDQLYVGASGAMVATIPASGEVQQVGSVVRVNVNTGTILVNTGAAMARVGFTGAYGDLLGLPTLGTAAAASTGDFAPAAQGVTNGNSHNHDGGDGAQIAYASLSGLPTLGTAAAQNVGTSAGNVVQLDNAAKLPAVDGSQLTNLPAGTSPAGSGTEIQYRNGSALGAIPNSSVDGATGAVTLARLILVANGAANTPPMALTGTWFTGGTSTTTKPALLIEPTGTTSTSWSTAGTGFGVNAPNGFTGNLLDLQLNGVTKFFVDSGIGAGFVRVSGGNTPSLGVVQSTGRRSTLSPLELRFFGTVNNSLVAITGEAAGTMAQRDGTAAQIFRVYDTYTSDTDFHRAAIATARATLSAVSGASATATALIPAGAVVMGVTSKVTTSLGTGNGTTGYEIGTASDSDRWGAITGTAAGTASDNRDWTAGTIECFPAATNVIVTAVGGNFNGTGTIYLSVQYMTGQVD
jgi:hypothetical protein